MKRDGCFGGRAAWARRATLVGAAGAVVLWPGGAARAGVEFLSSSDVTFRHDPDRESSAVAPRTLELSAVPTSSNLLSFQLNNTFTSGLANTRAVGGFGHVTNPTTATFVLKPGTGVTQDDPGNSAYPGSSSLKINIDTMWDVDNNGFGPLATGYISLAVGGVVGDGGSAKFIANLQFTDSVTNTPLRSDWVVNRVFDVPGTFAKTFTTSEVLLSSLAPLGTLGGAQQLRVKGYVEFRASNAVTPSRIEPLEMEIGGAPPTGSWTGLGADRNWTNPDNWITPDEPNPVLLPVVPNASGHRARFISRDGVQRTVNVNADVRLGTLDVDGFGAFVFEGSKITFETLRGPAVWNVRNVQGAQEHRMASITELLSPLQITTDTGTRLDLSGSVRGAGMSLTKFGDGRLRLGNTNQHGDTLVRGGVVAADVAGSLGLGSVNVQNAVLEYNAIGAITSGRTVTAGAGGIVELGITPTTADRFSVLSGGAISGSSIELSALTVGAGGNLQLQAGAIITNTQLQPVYPASLGSQPAYVLGVSDGLVLDVTVGTETQTPWKGIASTRGDVTFGTATNVLRLGGLTDVTVPRDSMLTIGSKLEVVGTTAALVKTGAGTAVLASTENVAFSSVVQNGTLLVNGAHPGGVTVQPQGVVGGLGSIGSVTLAAGGGSVAPGASVGSLSVGTLSLNSASTLDFEIDTPTNRDFLSAGSLTLDGKLNITALENFGPGRYTLLRSSSRSFVDQGLEIGDAPEQYAYDLITTVDPFRQQAFVILDVLGVKQWNGKGGGEWTKAANWLGPVPDVAGARASFLGAVTELDALIRMNGDRTVGRLEFDNNTSRYQLAPGSVAEARLIFDNGGSGALVEVNGGAHTISAASVALDDVDFDVNDSANLSVTAQLVVDRGKTVRKSGLGTVGFHGGIKLAPDARLLVNQGVLEAKHVLDGSVTIREGALLKIARDGGVSKINGLKIDGITGAWLARLDLGDNDLIVQATAATRQAVLAEVTNQLKTARGAGRTLWIYEGIGTSSATTIVSLAVALNDRGDGTPLYTSFGGLPVDANSVIVKYTYDGDANLDGRINADDYFRIDQGFLSPWMTHTYRTGDFNYDGRVNADDYFLIDRAFLGQGPALTSTTTASIAAVPEPGALLGAGLLCGALAWRRGGRRKG